MGIYYSYCFLVELENLDNFEKFLLHTATEEESDFDLLWDIRNNSIDEIINNLRENKKIGGTNGNTMNKIYIKIDQIIYTIHINCNLNNYISNYNVFIFFIHGPDRENLFGIDNFNFIAKILKLTTGTFGYIQSEDAVFIDKDVFYKRKIPFYECKSPYIIFLPTEKILNFITQVYSNFKIDYNVSYIILNESTHFESFDTISIDEFLIRYMKLLTNN